MGDFAWREKAQQREAAEITAWKKLEAARRAFGLAVTEAEHDAAYDDEYAALAELDEIRGQA